MKTFKYIFLIMITIGFCLSCDKDLLETVPNDRISNDVFWETEEDARLAANAVYLWLDGTNIFLWGAISDIGHVNQYNAFVNDLVRGIHDATTPVFESEWANAYGGIYAANRFLLEVDQVEADPDNIASMKAEVRTLRAWYYLRLVSLYGGVPLVTVPIDLETGLTLNRENAETIWNFIEQELTEAAVDLPSTRPSAEAGMITKGAALALKARAMLFNSEYRKAADAAKAVMDLGVYSLYPSYEDLFSYEAESNSEVIMEKGFLAGTYSNSVFNLMAPYSQKSSLNWYVPTQTLVDMYQTDEGMEITDPNSSYNINAPYTNRDPRLRYSLIVAQDSLPSGTHFFPGPFSGSPDAINSSFRASRTGYTLRKYVNFEDYDTPMENGINITLLRYAEVLLTYAEAKIELNEIDASVYEAINMIRQRPDVNMPPIEMGKTQEEMREIVRNERTVELAFEGLRYFDIRRWGIAEEVLNGKIYGFIRNGIPSELPSFERGFRPDRDYLWPIPFDEILLNPNLEQNPGY